MTNEPATDTPAQAKLRATAASLKAAAATKQEEETQLAVVVDKELAAMYKGDAGVGSASVTSEDLEVPSLKIIQKTSELDIANGEAPKLGLLYRSDTMVQDKEMTVNILCFKKVWSDNFNKTAQERKHIYYGAFDGSVDIFRMYLRGWSLTGSRKFLSEMKRLQLKQGLPMYALKVKLTTKEEHGVIKDTGKAYTTFSMIMTIVKKDELPLVETDMGRATWLKEMAVNFEKLNSSDEEEAPRSMRTQTKPTEDPGPQEENPAGVIPF